MPTLTAAIELSEDDLATFEQLTRNTVIIGGHPVYVWDIGGDEDTQVTPQTFIHQLIYGLIEDYALERRVKEEQEQHGCEPIFKTIKKAELPNSSNEFQFNTDTSRRAEILGFCPKRSKPSRRMPIHFSNLHVSRVKQLVDEKFIDLDAPSCNGAPTHREFMELIAAHPTIHVSGLACSDSSYPAILLTGASIPLEMNFTQEDKTALIQFAVTADELEIGTKLRPWWD